MLSARSGLAGRPVLLILVIRAHDRQGQKHYIAVDLVLADWKQIVQEIKAFAEITEAYNDLVSFQFVSV